MVGVNAALSRQYQVLCGTAKEHRRHEHSKKKMKRNTLSFYGRVASKTNETIYTEYVCVRKTTHNAHWNEHPKGKCDSPIVCRVILFEINLHENSINLFVISPKWRPQPLHYVIRCKWTKIVPIHSFYQSLSVSLSLSCIPSRKPAIQPSRRKRNDKEFSQIENYRALI